MELGKDSIVRNNVTIGDYSKIADNCWIDDMGDIAIGSNTNIGGHVRIYRHHHQEADLLWTEDLEDNYVVSDLVIGDHVFIGYGVMVLPGCTYIGNNSVIGAMSVVTKDIKDNEIWAGNPAKKIRDRKIVGIKDMMAPVKE